MSLKSFFQRSSQTLIDLADSLGFGETVSSIIAKIPGVRPENLAKATLIEKLASNIGVSPGDFVTMGQTERLSMDEETRLLAFKSEVIKLLLGDEAARIFNKGAGVDTARLEDRIKSMNVTPSAVLGFLLAKIINNKTMDVDLSQRFAIFGNLLQKGSEIPDTLCHPVAAADVIDFVAAREVVTAEALDDTDGDTGIFEGLGNWVESWFDSDEAVDVNETIQKKVLRRGLQEYDPSFARLAQFGTGNKSVVHDFIRDLSL